MKTPTIRLFAVMALALAMVSIAATNLSSPLDLVATTNGVGATPTVSTNVPVHVLPVAQQAQDQISQYLVMVIPIVVPVFLAYLKKFLPNVPSWALPILAPALGALADWIMQMAGVQTGGMVKGALLGSAGVGLRELQNQVSQAMPKQPPAALPPPPVAKPPGTP